MNANLVLREMVVTESRAPTLDENITDNICDTIIAMGDIMLVHFLLVTRLFLKSKL